jgi:hypothetical protein
MHSGGQDKGDVYVGKWDTKHLTYGQCQVESLPLRIQPKQCGVCLLIPPWLHVR